ncbi:MAG: GNAT family N-acetyltransferase [Sphingobacteriia bacterium]|nr:GNAT family N-acetyltransferase [Sphingobacteriia bacterium]
MVNIVIRIFEEKDIISIEEILKITEWDNQYINGQLEAIKNLCTRNTGEIQVAINNDVIVGFIQVEHYNWNRLSHIHGLIVHPDFRRLGIAKKLVKSIENSSKANDNRGIFVDTPINNFNGRKFYTSIGFNEAYIMPNFYENNLDGVTFQKFFEKNYKIDLNTVFEELKSREPIFHHPDKFGKNEQDILEQMCEGFWEVGASGNVYTQQDALEILPIRYNDPNYHDIWEAKDFKIMQIAPNNYLLTYILIQNNTRITRRSTIWRKQNDKWKILYHQGTIVSETNP